MSKTTWGDVKKGDPVELAGNYWSVTKIKRNGKTAKVVVERNGRTAKSDVRLKDRVKIAPRASDVFKKLAASRAPLQDSRGTQTRWATEKELRAAVGKPLPPGDAALTEPPEAPAGKKWDKPQGDAEKMLDKILGARLVAESKDEAQGYYVPPVDVSTVAAHLVVFHGGIPEACDDDEGKMLKAHDAQHAAALKGEAFLSPQHWHSERRP